MFFLRKNRTCVTLRLRFGCFFFSQAGAKWKIVAPSQSRNEHDYCHILLGTQVTPNSNSSKQQYTTIIIRRIHLHLHVSITLILACFWCIFERKLVSSPGVGRVIGPPKHGVPTPEAGPGGWACATKVCWKDRWVEKVNLDFVEILVFWMTAWSKQVKWLTMLATPCNLSKLNEASQKAWRI